MFQKRLSKVEVLEGGCAPWGYGKAWIEWNRSVVICYPIPINFVLRWIRELYFFLAQGVREEHEQKIQQSGYDQGFEAGKKYALDQLLRYHDE